MSINNYHKIISSGSNYTALAILNWQKRKQKLSDVCFTAEKVEKKHRALKLLCNLNERLEKLGHLINNVKRQQQKIAIEAQKQFIILECSNMLCQDGPGGFLMSVKANRFEEGDYNCGNCGCVMRVEGSSEIDEMLEEMGIGLPRYA